MQTTPNLGMVLPSSDSDPFDEMAFVNALLKVDTAAVKRILRGKVSAAGGIVVGSGYTITKGVTGVYTVNFSVAFTGAAPIIVGSCAVSGDNVNFTGDATLNSATVILLAANTSAQVDHDFDFLVVSST